MKHPRLVEDHPLPDYAYIPGKTPRQGPWLHTLIVSLLRDDPSQRLLHHYALDLFNQAFPWEAHEAWETLWQACGRAGTDALFYKALIKLAAARVKLADGRPVGVATHLQRARSLLTAIAEAIGGAHQCYLGLELRDLLNLTDVTVWKEDFSSVLWPKLDSLASKEVSVCVFKG